MANPASLTPWKKGQSGNPGGLTKEARKLIDSNALRASKLRAKLLDELEKPDADKALTAEILRMIKDSEDRGYGAPKQEVDQTVSGEVIFKTVYE